MSGLRLTLYGEIDPSPTKTWLVKGLLGASELSCIFGAPGSGKSVLVGDLAASVAAGAAWFDRDVLRGSVLYVAAERAGLVKRRFAAVRAARGWSELPLGIIDGAIDLRSSATSRNEIVAHAKSVEDIYRQPVVLIIVDTVSRALAGGDENSPRDMGALVGHASALQQATGAHVCLIHHIPQDGSQRLRGHGALLGAVDTSIGVEKHAANRTATVDKANDSEEGERIVFDLESWPISDDGTTAPIVISSGEPVVKDKAKRRLPDKYRNAHAALLDLCVNGQAIALGGLPAGVRGVKLGAWRDELYLRGVLDQDHANPREDFSRVRQKLIAEKMAGERDGLIWAA